MATLIIPTDSPVVSGPPQGQWTYADWEALPDDGNRYEVIGGVLYMSTAPSFLHQRIIRQIFLTPYAHIDTAGGCLKRGNVTFLLRVAELQVESVKLAIQQTCRTRTQMVNPLPPALVPDAMFILEPVEVEVGGATVWILDIERFVSL